MAIASFEGMSRADLIQQLKSIHEAEERLAQSLDATSKERLIHELQLHHLELRAQNADLRSARDGLDESKRRYRDLYDLAPIGYCSLDAAGCITDINVVGAALLGSFKEWLVGHRLSAVTLVKEKDRFLEHLQRCRAGEDHVATELTLSTTGSRNVVLQVVSSPDRAADGTVTGYRTALVDITAQKKLEMKLRFLIRAGAELAAPMSFEATLVTATHLPVPELADLCFVDVLSDRGELERVVVFSDEPELAERLKGSQPSRNSPQMAVVLAGEPMLIEGAGDDPVTEVRPAGALRLRGRESLIIAPLSVAGRNYGALTFVSGQAEHRYTLEDLELASEFARRAALALDNAKLFEQNQREILAREQLLAIVSHDLRGPLGSLLMGAELMLETPADEDRRTDSRRIAESMHRSATRMNRLITDLLDVARIEGGQLPFRPERHLVEELVADTLDAHQPMALAKGLVLERELGESAGEPVLCDRERILQVFSNLLGNAIKFASRGVVTVGAELRVDEVVFSVSDEGSGISPASLPRIFDRFWSADDSSKKGAGLGLAIAKGIVDVHGGRIWAESEEGVGSTFFFTVPRWDDSDADLAEPPTAREETAQPIVLVVDDDRDVRDAVSNVLRQAQYEVHAASNGQKALEHVRKHGVPDLILLDLLMPVMDGWAFLEERNRDADLRSIPVLVASGEQGVARRVTLVNAEFLPKPFERESLLRAVRGLVT